MKPNSCAVRQAWALPPHRGTRGASDAVTRTVHVPAARSQPAWRQALPPVWVTLPVCPSSAGPAGNTRPGARPAVSGSLDPLFFAKAFPGSNILVFIVILDVYLENWIH